MASINNRLFYGVKGIGARPDGSTASATTIHGVQTLGIDTTFNLEQINEIGQIATYSSVEDVPDVNVSMQKVLDGYPLIYHLATQGAAGSTLSGRSTKRCQMVMSVFPEVHDAASGTAITEVLMSGLYVNSLTYTLPVDGNCTEDITLVGNSKVWRTSAFIFDGTTFNTIDSPLAPIQRRQHVLYQPSAITSGTLLPAEIPGITSSGTNNTTVTDVFDASVQNITISADLGREGLRELGRKKDYYKFVNFPVTVTTSIEIICKSGDMVNALDTGVDNTSDRTIKVLINDGTRWDMGSKNRLQSVTFGGGAAQGGNDSCTFSYSNSSSLDVKATHDPTTALRP